MKEVEYRMRIEMVIQINRKINREKKREYNDYKKKLPSA